MGKGRAKAFIIAQCVGIFGSALTFIELWSLFLVAKFIVGASIGLTGVIVARFIEEYVPLKWFGTS
jgi:MFS family permease